MTPRIPLPGPDDLEADTAALLELTAPPDGEPAATMALLAWQPELLSPFLGWAAALALNGTLPPRDHELVALRVAWNCRSAFEWAEHAGYARRAGLTDAEIASVPDGSIGTDWTAHEAALLGAADELHHGTDLADTTFDELASHYAPATVVEIVFVVGQYTMLSMVANAAGLEAPAGLDQLPSRPS
jgi:4-carboxymuconolactone decarboxylase